MSTPGNVTIVSKALTQSIPPTGSVDGGTLLRFRDVGQNVDTDRLALPIGDTSLNLQIQARFATATAKRPTWVQLEVARCRLRNGVWSYDTTGKSRRAVVQPGTTTWADTFSIPETIDSVDGYFGWTLTHGRQTEGGPPDPIEVTVLVYEAKNPLAHQVYRLGGWNEMSDGSVSRDAWRVV